MLLGRIELPSLASSALKNKDIFLAACGVVMPECNSFGKGGWFRSHNRNATRASRPGVFGNALSIGFED